MKCINIPSLWVGVFLQQTEQRTHTHTPGNINQKTHKGGHVTKTAGYEIRGIGRKTLLASSLVGDLLLEESVKINWLADVIGNSGNISATLPWSWRLARRPIPGSLWESSGNRGVSTHTAWILKRLLMLQKGHQMGWQLLSYNMCLSMDVEILEKL